MFALEVVATARKDNLKCFTVQYLSKFLLNWYLWKTAWSICSSHFFRSLGLNSGYATELSVALKKKKKKTKQAPGLPRIPEGPGQWLEWFWYTGARLRKPKLEQRFLGKAQAPLSWAPALRWLMLDNCSSWPEPGARPLPAVRNLCLWARTKSSWRTQGRKFSRGLVPMMVVLFAYKH